MTPDRQVSGELAHELGRHARLLHVLKSRMATWAPAGLDGAAFGLLMTLVKCGPTRQGELADNSLLDPSTVSRYVAQLVRSGFVVRRPDPVDGRAVQLAATDQGHAVGAEAVARRERLVSDMLATWSDHDARTLVHLLRRLNDEMDSRRDTAPPTPAPPTADTAALTPAPPTAAPPTADAPAPSR